MRRLVVAALCLSGCTSARDVVVDGALEVEAPCEVDATGALRTDPIAADVANSFTWRVPLSVVNRGDRGVVPDRFDFRWECDDTGFTGDAGALFVPAFDRDTPFCLASDAVNRAGFVGFGLVAASGPRIGPGEIGVVEVELVPPTLGDGLDELFSLARLADTCLRSNPVGDDATPECSAFYTAWPYDAATPDDVTRLSPFARFDGRYVDEVLSVREGSSPPVVGPAYRLTAQGILLLQTDESELVQTNEIEVSIDVCRNCGARQEDLRQPRSGFECYHPAP